MTNHSTVDDDFEAKAIALEAAIKDTLVFLTLKRETATDAAEHGKAPVAVNSVAVGQATEDDISVGGAVGGSKNAESR